MTDILPMVKSSALRPYPAYNPSGIEWLGDVPAHWEMLPGRACYEEKSPQINTGLQETTVLSLSYGEIVIKPPKDLHGLVPASFETYQIVEPRDIIVRPTDLQNDWNSLRFGISSHRGIITSAYICLATSRHLTFDYGHLVCHAYDLKKVFYGLGSGLRQNLSWRDFKYLPCPVPPLDEQTAIVHYLDRADDRIRRAISAKGRLIELLTEQRQATIHSAVTRGLDPNVPLKDSGVEWLGDVPEYWDVRRLKAICHFAYGDTLTADMRLGGDVPVYGSNGCVGSHSSANTAAPCIVIGRKGSFGKVNYVNHQTFAIDTTYFVDHRYSQANLRWLYYLLDSIGLDDVTKDSAIPGLSREDAYQRIASVPPINEQNVIAHYLDKATADTDTAIDKAQRQIDLLREYRTRLIADVVTGQVDVRGAVGDDIELPVS